MMVQKSDFARECHPPLIRRVAHLILLLGGCRQTDCDEVGDFVASPFALLGIVVRLDGWVVLAVAVGGGNEFALDSSPRVSQSSVNLAELEVGDALFEVDLVLDLSPSEFECLRDVKTHSADERPSEVEECGTIVSFHFFLFLGG